MFVLSGSVVALFGLVLVGFAGLAFVRPGRADSFVQLFASTRRAHVTEQVVRLVFGAGLIHFSPMAFYPAGLRVLGWALVITSLLLLVLPWRWHFRFGRWAVPLVRRHLRLYAICALLLGLALLGAVVEAVVGGVAG